MTKVLVTGGLGMIGSFVCRALVNTSRQPVIYDISTDTGLILDIMDDCKILHGDICDLPRLIGVVSEFKPSAIIHLAGQTGPHVEHIPWSSINSNLIGTINVFECARFSSNLRIVFSSSKRVYGMVQEKHRHPRYEPVPEEHSREPLGPNGKVMYTVLKRTCEDLADHYAKLYCLDIVALRFGTHFGPGKFGRPVRETPSAGLFEAGLIEAGLIEAAMANRRTRIEFGADQCDDLCYSGECANGVIAALDSGPCPGTLRIYNISSGELISLREMIAALKQLYPLWDCEAGAGLDYRGSGVGYHYRMATQKARTELGFKPLFDFRRAAIDYGKTLECLERYRSGCG